MEVRFMARKKSDQNTENENKMNAKKTTRKTKAVAEAAAEAVVQTETAAPKKRGRKPKNAVETAAVEAPVKKRGRKKAAPEIVAETVPPIEAETAVESVAVDTTAPETVVEVPDEPLPGQLAFDSDESPVADAPAKKPRKPRAKKADAAPKRRGRPPKSKAPELVLTTTLQVGDAEFDISAIAEKAYKEYKRVHRRKVITDFHVYVKPEEGAAYFTINGEGSEDFKIDLT
jgi:hypothetical protein